LNHPSVIRRHCEEPLGDEAIQGRSNVRVALDRHAAKSRLAMTVFMVTGL
jgi:hypothetical protein